MGHGQAVHKMALVGFFCFVLYFMFDSFLCQYFVEWFLCASIVLGSAEDMTEEDKVPGFKDF